MIVDILDRIDFVYFVWRKAVNFCIHGHKNFPEYIASLGRYYMKFSGMLIVWLINLNWLVCGMLLFYDRMWLGYVLFFVIEGFAHDNFSNFISTFNLWFVCDLRVTCVFFCFFFFISTFEKIKFLVQLLINAQLI